MSKSEPRERGGEVSMSDLSREQVSFLEGKFGKRVNFDKLERKLYSHDIASIPSMVRPLVGNTTPRRSSLTLSSGLTITTYP
jgi:hypothetical protein